MTLEIQEFFMRGGTFELLEAQYAIKAKRHQDYPNLVLFKYDQIHSPFQENIVRECRGIILDQDDNWEIVSRAFDKFFNYGEGHAADIDWSTAKVQEKVDGSLAVLYHYAGQWHVATSGTPDARGDVHGNGVTFKDLFWKVWNEHGYETPSDPDWVYVFELTTPLNRIVVPHMDYKLTFLACRNRRTQQEAPVVEHSHFPPPVKSFSLTSFEDIARSFETMSPLTQEGYVVVDAQFNRVKVKHPGYVALHHAKDGMNEKAFVEIVRSGEKSEVLSAFPEFQPMMDDVSKRYEKLLEQTTGAYAEISDVREQREFAQLALKHRFSSALFAIRAKKTGSFREFFRNMRIDHLMSLMETA